MSGWIGVIERGDKGNCLHLDGLMAPAVVVGWSMRRVGVVLSLLWVGESLIPLVCASGLLSVV